MKGTNTYILEACGKVHLICRFYAKTVSNLSKKIEMVIIAYMHLDQLHKRVPTALTKTILVVMIPIDLNKAACNHKFGHTGKWYVTHCVIGMLVILSRVTAPIRVETHSIHALR